MTRTVTVLGTVMGVVRTGRWYVHDVDATSPDGDRVPLQVVSTRHHQGGVTIRWDPGGAAEPRFLTTRVWTRSVATALAIGSLVVFAWLVLA